MIDHAASFDFAQDERYRSAMMFFVYILECSDGSYYVESHRGDTVLDRVNDHNNGIDNKAYTFTRRPVRLLWNGDFDDPEEMIAFERQLKGWSRAKKEAFIKGDFNALKELAKSRTAPSDHTKGRFFKLTGINPNERSS